MNDRLKVASQLCFVDMPFGLNTMILMLYVLVHDKRNQNGIKMMEVLRCVIYSLAISMRTQRQQDK
jgi:hypothetical protein